MAYVSSSKVLFHLNLKVNNHHHPCSPRDLFFSCDLKIKNLIYLWILDLPALKYI